MSTIRYFDSVPYIVRYGMRDEEKGESWTLFYCNAVCFRAKVYREDVINTPFGEQWQELNKEPRTEEEMKVWVERWNKMCDCVIAQCMPVLNELAPPTRQWKTLEDHLRTPSYELKLVADPETGDAVAKVLSGPVEKPSYEHHLLPFSNFRQWPENLPRYRAQDLVVLGQDTNWRSPPAKVQAPNGDLFYFLSCNRRSKHMPTGEVSNASVDKINAYSRLRERSNGGECPNIPKLIGVVISGADREVEDWDAEGNLTATMGQRIPGDSQQPLVAGVLLSYVSKAKHLADLMKTSTDQARDSAISKAMEKWRAQMTLAVQYLHDRGIAIGGRTNPDSPWYYINQYTIHIAPIKRLDGSDKVDPASLVAADAWLMLDATCTMLPDEKESQQQQERFEEHQAMDWKALEQLFQA